LSKSTRLTIYESFVRCHLLYGLVVWGGAKKIILKPLMSTLSKIWRKFGHRYEHTLNRLKNNSILKFEDELSLQESKFLWRWDKKKLSTSLISIISE